MKINSAQTCLSLALRALEKKVAPAVTTGSARDSVENVCLILKDLLRREGEGVAFLKGYIDEGEALCAKANVILDNDEKALPSKALPSLSSPDFESLVAIHEDLTWRLDTLLAKLVATRPSDLQVGLILREAAEWEQKYYVRMPQLAVKPWGESPGFAQAEKLSLTAEKLESFLRSSRGDDSLKVMQFEAVPGGYGNQTFFATLRSQKLEENETEEIVVRKADAATIILPLDQEFDLISALVPTGYPVAKPLDLSTKLAGVDGIFFTSERLPGQMCSSRVDGEKAQFSEKLLLKLAELLGQLHSLPLETFREYITKYYETSISDETNEQRFRRKLAYYKKFVQDVPHPPSPYITWLFSWLDANVPEDARRPVITHGDFNVHNILQQNDEVTGVLDWECSDFLAPEMDLAYLQPVLSAHMDWNQWIAHYIKYGGQLPDPSSMLFCAVFSGFRLALAFGRLTRDLQTGANREDRFINMEQNLMAVITSMGLQPTAALANAKAQETPATLAPQDSSRETVVKTKNVYVEVA
jgi:aminoglycoside phosphotransferase (APT) family kinase protein